MGWLKDLWHGKGHELYDQLAYELAQATAQSIRDNLQTGKPIKESVEEALNMAANEVRILQARGMNIFGFARLLKSYENALVMIGLSRNAASDIKAALRQKITFA